jgi:UPF0755 protein
MTRVARGALVTIVLVIAATGVAAWVGYTRTQEPYRGFVEAERFVEIAPGASSSAIGRRLVEAGVVRDPLTFRAAVWLSGRARDLKAGEYRFDRPLSAVEVVDKIARGDVYYRLLTFPEGLTLADMAALFEARGFGSAADFLAAASNPAPVAALDPEARDLEGYLLPETYTLTRGTTAADLVADMAGAFVRAFDPAMRDAARAAGLTVRQVVTLASLVEKETGHPDERSMVAAVYLNRIRRRMALQADPTVVYALKRAGRYNGNISKADLLLDSPYNTYRHPGWPPGPIAAPGLASLGAAVNPAPVDYLYFVSRNDGTHVFASTLAEHNRNVRRWQVEYFRKRR